MAQDDEKKVEGEPPPPEAILATEEQRDPEEATFAEQAIHHYVGGVLDAFRDSVETSLSSFAAWAESQTSKDAIDNEGFNSQIGDVFLQQMLMAFGGKETPIGAAAFEQLDGRVDEATRDEETAFCVQELAGAARDFTWYLRDNLQAVLSNQWDQLRDLAYEGSQDFIPALHAFGLPRPDWSSTEMSSTMIAMGDKAIQGQPKTEEEAVEKDPEQEKEQQQQALAEEEEKNQQAV